MVSENTTTAPSVLDEIVRRIVEVAHPDRVVLFGSRARGDATEDSDYDILVVAPTEEKTWRRAVPIHMALGGVPVGCDIIWRTAQEIDEWRNVRSHLLTTAMREGRVLYDARADRPSAAAAA